MRPALPLVLGVFAVGAVARILGGIPLLASSLAGFSGPDAAAPAAPGSAGRADTPEEAVLSFFNHLQGGEYGEAWEVALEPVWPGEEKAGYADSVVARGRPAGWTTQDVFVRRCEEEIGPRAKLNGLQAVRLTAPPDLPESAAISFLPAGRVAGVRVSGHILGACQIYRWDRDVDVVEAGGAWRLLLPGTKAPRSLFHQSWFTNLSLIGSLRVVGK